MTAQELIDQHKIYLEDLDRWVVPLEAVEEALLIKSTKEVDESLSNLKDQMEKLNEVFNDLGKING